MTNLSTPDARGWTDLPDDELLERVTRAAGGLDQVELWSLMESHQVTHGGAGSRVSPRTLAVYQVGLATFLSYASDHSIDLLNPGRDDGAGYVRHLEGVLKPSSVRVYLAAARCLYKALRWSRATDADPFVDVRAARDRTQPWDRRQPYAEDEVGRLLDAAQDVEDRTLVLLGAHAGLRVSEALRLSWAFVGRKELVVEGKGRKTRRVTISRTLAAALDDLRMESCGDRPASGRLFSVRTTEALRDRLKALCDRAGVTYEGRGYHALRHYSGTRLYRECRDLRTVADHLGHASLETARIYAKWASEALLETVGRW